MKQFSVSNVVLSFIAFMGFWLAMSGFFDVVHISFGVICVVAVIAFNNKLKRHVYYEDEIRQLNQFHFFRSAWYAVWMFWQIIKAGLQVTMVLIRPSLPIAPSIVRFKVDLPSAHARMILGNSITLTPGTLTVDITGDEFIVHSLIPASYEGIVDDSMPKQVLRLFEKSDRPVVSDVRITNAEGDA